MGDVIPPLAPNGLAGIIEHYGDPKVSRDQDGNWTVDPAWERANCITVQHGLLPRGKLYVHQFVAQPLLRKLDRWAARIAAGDPYRLRTMGCFQPRAQRGSNGLLASTHSFAIAEDTNGDTNRLIMNIDPEDPRRRTCPLIIDGEVWRDIPDEWVADAEAEGWFWGGRFHNRFDPMHFQMATGY
jgi:hypothetical protein